MIPFDASIDFERVMDDIRATGYKGVIMLECSPHGLVHTYEDYTAREFYERSYAAAKKLASLGEVKFSNDDDDEGWSAIYRP